MHKRMHIILQVKRKVLKLVINKQNCDPEVYKRSLVDPRQKVWLEVLSSDCKKQSLVQLQLKFSTVPPRVLETLSRKLHHRTSDLFQRVSVARRHQFQRLHQPVWRAQGISGVVEWQRQVCPSDQRIHPKETQRFQRKEWRKHSTLSRAAKVVESGPTKKSWNQNSIGKQTGGAKCLEEDEEWLGQLRTDWHGLDVRQGRQPDHPGDEHEPCSLHGHQNAEGSHPTAHERHHSTSAPIPCRNIGQRNTNL